MILLQSARLLFTPHNHMTEAKIPDESFRINTMNFKKGSSTKFFKIDFLTDISMLTYRLHTHYRGWKEKACIPDMNFFLIWRFRIKQNVIIIKSSFFASVFLWSRLIFFQTNISFDIDAKKGKNRRKNRKMRRDTFSGTI